LGRENLLKEASARKKKLPEQRTEQKRTSTKGVFGERTNQKSEEQNVHGSIKGRQKAKSDIVSSQVKIGGGHGGHRRGEGITKKEETATETWLTGGCTAAGEGH